MILYNCKSIPDSIFWRVTKFDAALNVEASYEVSVEGLCTCPSWPRKQHCKHITIVDRFRARKAIDTDWFYDPQGNGWHRPIKGEPTDLAFGSTPFPSDPGTLPLPESEAAEGASLPARSAVSIRRRIVR